MVDAVCGRFDPFTDEFEFHWVSLDRHDVELKRAGRADTEWGGQFFHRIPRGRVTVDLLLRYLPSKRLLLRELRAIQPDLIHCWGSERPFGAVFPHSKVPKILSMQGILTTYKRIDAIPPRIPVEADCCL